MSFDLLFLSLNPGETWSDVMDRLEAAADDVELDDHDLRRWDAVRVAVDPLLPRAEVFVGAAHRELSDDASGIQISLFHGELSLSVPYWTSGAEAQVVVERLRALARAIEQTTGLTTYDPQADAAFLGEGEQTAAAVFDQVAGAFHPSPPAPVEEPGLFKRLFGRSR